MKTVIKLIASGLYTGYSPIAPGTIGSILGVLIFLQLYGFTWLYVITCLLLILVGFLVSERAEEIYGKKDPRRITIDEIAGMCIVYLGMKPRLWIILAGFLLFRIFDIVKPFPIRNVEKLKGSFGVMLDDIIAAIYTNLILQIFIKVAFKSGS